MRWPTRTLYRLGLVVVEYWLAHLGIMALPHLPVQRLHIPYPNRPYYNLLLLRWAFLEFVAANSFRILASNERRRVAPRLIVRVNCPRGGRFHSRLDLVGGGLSDVIFT